MLVLDVVSPLERVVVFRYPLFSFDRHNRIVAFGIKHSDIYLLRSIVSPQDSSRSVVSDC
jgi:hypothetical protein